MDTGILGGAKKSNRQFSGHPLTVDTFQEQIFVVYSSMIKAEEFKRLHEGQL